MHTHLHRVRYHEVDQQGYMFNGRYLDVVDVAMTEYFRDLGWTYPQLNELGFDPSVVNIEAQFLAPSRMDELLAFEVHCGRVGSSSFSLITSVTRDGTKVATFSIVHVNVDAVSARSIPIPSKVADAMRKDMNSSEDS